MANYISLKTLIDSEPANAARTDVQVLAWLQGPSGSFQSRLLNARQLMAEIGASSTAIMLDKIEAVGVTNPAVKWAAKFFATEGIDLGSTETRKMITQLASGGIITTAERDTLLALAPPLTRADTIGWPLATLSDVSRVRII